MQRIKADPEREGWIVNAATYLLNRLPHRFVLNIEMITAAILDPGIQHLAAIDEWLEDNNETRVSALNRIALELEIDIDTSSDISHPQQYTSKNPTDLRSILIKKHSVVTKRASNLEDEVNRFLNITDDITVVQC